MCGIYGVLSYKDKLKDMNELVDLLGMESAERGTDATCAWTAPPKPIS